MDLITLATALFLVWNIHLTLTMLWQRRKMRAERERRLCHRGGFCRERCPMRVPESEEIYCLEFVKNAAEYTAFSQIRDLMATLNAAAAESSKRVGIDTILKSMNSTTTQ